MLRLFYLLSLPLLLISYSCEASNFQDGDDEWLNEAALAQIDQAVFQYQQGIQAQPAVVEESEDYGLDFFDAIDNAIKEHKEKTPAVEKRSRPESSPLKLGMPKRTKTANLGSAARALFKDETEVEPALPLELQDLALQGTRMKLIANVFKGNLKENANIFVPRYRYERIAADGSVEVVSDFFKTPKNQIVFFASGGTSNAWEKTVSRVFRIFFDQPVKVVRAGWMHKHLKRLGITTFNMKDYEDNETELHTEFFYNLFVRNFFLDTLEQEVDKISNLQVDAYSWWEVCDTCETTLTRLNSHCVELGLLPISYRTVTARPYAHSYEATLISSFAAPQDLEAQVWSEIWEKLKGYMKLHIRSPEEREEFWTNTVEGLELCKWIGQAFVENRYLLDGRFSEPDERGDLLKFFAKINSSENSQSSKKQQAEMKRFRQFILYLSKVNWDMSCWFRSPYVSTAQFNWKKYRQQRVEPHFGYEELDTYRDETASTVCQMCGQKNLVDVTLVFHPKYNVSAKLLRAMSFAEDDGGLSPMVFDDSNIEQDQRMKSLEVGSECVKYMLMPREEIDEWREKHPIEVTEVNSVERAQLLGTYDTLDKVAAEQIYGAIREGCESNGGTVTTRYLSKHTDYATAKDMEPFLKILIAQDRIEKAGHGAYKLKAPVNQ